MFTFALYYFVTVLIVFGICLLTYAVSTVVGPKDYGIPITEEEKENNNE